MTDIISELQVMIFVLASLILLKRDAICIYFSPYIRQKDQLFFKYKWQHCIRWKRVVLVYDPGQEEKKKEKSVEEKFVVAEDVETNKQDDNANVSIAVNEHNAQDLLNRTGLESNSQDLGKVCHEHLIFSFPT